jgi:2-polyprenyl-6-methoxyphenol hydroxylase-like FAD-dependent oxidoreductase
VTEPVDVLIVGAGPTGLTLAAQLQAFGTGFRLVDRQPDRVHESRALAVQPRTLEVLAGLGLADTMVERGNPTVDLEVHGRTRTTRAPLFDIGLDDTRFPFLLFLSQAETERILDEHLTAGGATIERGVELVGITQHPDHVACTLHHRDGHTEQVEARYVVGCDGAHSAVRQHAGIGFTGAAYPQTFVLADLDADGPRTGAAHGYLSPDGLLFLFPLGQPAPWRMLVTAPGSVTESADTPPGLDELQALADNHTGGAARLHDPVWSTYFRIHHRHATSYRRGRAFLAGDAAHIHSPAGAQGMNTGIQEAWNLGWKLALVVAGDAPEDLLGTYETERMPIGRYVLRLTDQAFRIATSTNPAIRLLRTRLAPDLIRLGLSSRRGRALAFRSLSQLAISYRRSPACQEGEPRLRRGARAGDRSPTRQWCRTGDRRPPSTRSSYRQGSICCSPRHRTPCPPTLRGSTNCAARASRCTGWPAIRNPERSTTHRARRTRAWVSSGPGPTAHHLVRPDGHIAYRAAGTDLAGLDRYITRGGISHGHAPLDRP